jgi:tripartite ATP-independent transporter DctM subunit
MTESDSDAQPRVGIACTGKSDRDSHAQESEKLLPLPTLLVKVDVVIDTTLKALLVAVVLAELGVIFSHVVSRSAFNAAFVWTDEAARLILMTLGFIGGAFAYRRGEHAFIRFVIDVLPAGLRRACYTTAELLILMLAITTGINALPLIVARWSQPSPILGFSMAWFAFPILASMFLIAVTATERLFVQYRSTLWGVGPPFSALVLALILTRGAWRPWLAGEGALVVSISLFFLTVLFGLPVSFGLQLGALLYLYGSGTAPMVALPQKMISGIDNFILLAIPFFILAAKIMDKGGVSLRLVRFVQAFVGHLRGGLFQVMVVSMYIVSGISGSKVADVAAVGSVMRDMLRREGYNLEQATAVLAASAVMGETVPPSIPMLVLGSVTSISIGALFVGGIIPAAVVGVCLMVLIYFQARKTKARCAPRATLREMATASLGGVLPLLMLVILLGGIVLGIATPTEVSSVAVVYGILLAGLFYRELGLREFLRGVVDCAATAGMILFILATSSSFAWTLTVSHLQQRIVTIMTSIHGSHWLFMLATVGVLVVAGVILEGLPALVIFAPLLLPIATQIGINRLHYGIVLVIAMGVGAFLPPIGSGFFITCALCETSIEGSTRKMIPFVIVLLIGLVLVALIPWFTLYLPVKMKFVV